MVADDAGSDDTAHRTGTPRRSPLGAAGPARDSWRAMAVSAVKQVGGRRPRSGRAPGHLHVALMIALLIVFALFTFSPPPSNAPAIAEVAPQALEQIVEAPIEQAVSPGGDDGGIGAAATPTTVPATIPPRASRDEVEEVLTPFRCAGDPPRQIEDPQSPPCVPVWSGDNGGATYQGVTGDTITVAVPDLHFTDPRLKAFETFFNTRFQLYGRKLVLKGLVTEQPVSGDESSDQQQFAAKVDEEHQAFATLPMFRFQGTVYYRELARRGVLSMTDSPLYTHSALEDLKPYVWQYGMALDRMMSVTGEWMCKRLAGRTADYTSDVRLLGNQRKFGLIVASAASNRFAATPLVDALGVCGAEFAVTRQLEQAAVGNDYSQSAAVRSAVADLKGEGVTSVLCMCHPAVLGALGIQASQQDYYPEWLVSGYWQQEFLAAQRISNPEARQRLSMFGLTFSPRLIRAADDPSIWALNDADPSAFNGNRDDSSANRQGTIQKHYRTLLLLASGIQMAGPNLTPETFARGLHTTTFPNPDHPIQAGRVGFQGGSYSMLLDAAEMWWSNTSPSPYRGDDPGTWCYVNGGARRSPGSWPGEPRYFEGACDSGR